MKRHFVYPKYVKRLKSNVYVTVFRLKLLCNLYTYSYIIQEKNMLELIKKIKRENKLDETIFVSNVHYPSSVREWDNSIYLYTKSKLNLIPYASKISKKLIKGILEIFNLKIEKRMRSKRLLLRFRRLSSNRIYMSEGEFKHTNNKVLINIYIFNRQVYNYIYKLKKRYLKKFMVKKSVNKRIINKINSINIKSAKITKNLNRNKYYLLNKLNIMQKGQDYKINIINKLSFKTKVFYKRFSKLTIRKLRLYFFYKQLIHINRSKLNYNYLYVLKKQLENLYNKNVEFNLINLNRFYLNSDILFESVKLKVTRNRRRLHKIFNKLKTKVKIYDKKYSLDYTNKYETNLKKIGNKLSLNNSVFNNLNYKHVTGFRLEARGRLNKRFTAARSITKLKHKGNLLNLDSSFRGLSSVLLKGNLRSNLQYTKLSSITRIGAFGIKGWVSGY